jgi:signal transduction histidine kinase
LRPWPGRISLPERIFLLQAFLTSAVPVAAVLAERRRLEQAFRESEARYRLLAENTSEFITLKHGLKSSELRVAGLSRAARLRARGGHRHPDHRTRPTGRSGRGGGRQLLAVVNDILDFQRLDAGGMRLHARDFDLGSLCESVVSVLRPAAADKGLAFELTVPLDAPPLRGDPVRLKQILFNLVGNAIKFTASGHVELRCRCVGRADGLVELRVEVRDTGIGIAPEPLAT